MIELSDKRLLIFLRHGSALDKDEALETGVADFDRELIPRGIKCTKKSAKKIADFFDFDDRIKVVTSPSRRCLETAEILVRRLKKLNFKASLHEDMSLEAHQAPPAFTLSVQRHLREWSVKRQARSHLIFVGHEPHLGEWVSALLMNGGQLELSQKNLEQERVTPSMPSESVGYTQAHAPVVVHWPKSGFAVFEWDFEKAKGTLKAFGR